MAAYWYVLRIKPHKERVVYRQLRAKDVDVYFPAVRVKPVNPRASKVRPFFPGYIFVRIDLAQEGENVLRWVPGTRGLVRFGGIPATVPQNLIQELKKRIAQMQTATVEQESELKKGDRVKITDGPFAGYEAIFDTHLSGNERAQVLLAYLSYQPHRITVDAASVERVENR